MKRAIRTSLLVGTLLAVGCGQASLPGTGGLNGAGAVTVTEVPGLDAGVQIDAMYGQLSFITSSNSDDLKALDLIVTDSSQTRNYVPAPNPLQPLSVPTVNQPVEMAPSVRYGQVHTLLTSVFPNGYMDGQPITGMLMFVRGAASNTISVVGVANVPESLRQLANGLLIQSAGVVTAISARLTTTQDNVVLYYATSDGENATVWEQVFEHPVTTSPSFPGVFPTALLSVSDCGVKPPSALPNKLYACPPRPVRTYQAASVSALQVLPTISSDTLLPENGGIEGGRLGVAIRNLVPPLNDPSLSSSGEVRIIDPGLPADLDANGTSTDPLFRIARLFAPFEVQPPLIPGAPAQPPIRALLTHPRAFDILPDGGTTVLPPPINSPSVVAYEGARLFAVLDEASCHASLNCSGILAIDAAPVLPDGGTNANYGLLAFDNSDCLRDAPSGQFCVNALGTTNRMLALRPGSGLIQGVAFASGVSFPAPTSYNQGFVSLLGTVTLSSITIDHLSAQIFFFDALGLRALNENTGPGITNGVSLVVPGILEEELDGGVPGTTTFIVANVSEGLYPASETITITNGADIPGLSLVKGIPYDAGISEDGGVEPVLAWPVPDAGAVFALHVLQVNDLMVPVNLSGTLCQITTPTGGLYSPYELVTGVDLTGSNIFTVQAPGTPPFDLRDCPGASGYIAVAGPHSAQPFLVSGTFVGLLGRMSAGTYDPVTNQPMLGPTLVVPNDITDALGQTFPRFFNPNVDAGVVIVDETIFTPGGPDGGTFSPPLTIQMPPVDPEFLANPGSYYTFVLSSGFQGAALPIDASGLGFGGLFLPGGVAQSRVIDVNGEFVLDIVAFPSSNTVIDFLPSILLLNTPNSGAINVHF